MPLVPASAAGCVVAARDMSPCLPSGRTWAMTDGREPKEEDEMDIDSMTLRDIRAVAALAATLGLDGTQAPTPWPVGKNVIVRTVTMIQVGRLVAVTPHELVLVDAAWVADTGRFGECLATGTVAEAEPFPDGEVVVGRGAVVDACEWRHPLIRVAKG